MSWQAVDVKQYQRAARWHSGVHSIIEIMRSAAHCRLRRLHCTRHADDVAPFAPPQFCAHNRLRTRRAACLRGTRAKTLCTSYLSEEAEESGSETFCSVTHMRDSAALQGTAVATCACCQRLPSALRSLSAWRVAEGEEGRGRRKRKGGRLFGALSKAAVSSNMRAAFLLSP